jgi:excinuclease ABC subunit A
VVSEDTLKNIIIKGAEQHNLKKINLNIPRDQLIVLTGVSGSGKSSLAFDTIYAEGNRRYIESLSAYARQFMDQMSKPAVDSIEGLSPSISISQKTTSYNPRSTVGTVTEIYDFMRVLFARVGTAHCPKCEREIKAQSITNITNQIMNNYDREAVMILAPIIRDRKGEYQKELMRLRESGFTRVRIDGDIQRLDELTDEQMILSRYYRHTIEVIVDRLSILKENKERVIDAVEQAINLTDGLVGILKKEAYIEASSAEIIEEEVDERERENDEEQKKQFIKSEIYSVHLACPVCGISFPELEPRNFSFNSVHGACPKCDGLGTNVKLDQKLLITDEKLSLANGALDVYDPDKKRFRHIRMNLETLQRVAKRLYFTIDTPIKDLTERQKEALFYGPKKPISFDVTYNWEGKRGGVREVTYNFQFKGLLPRMKKRYEETSSNYIRNKISKYTRSIPCPECNGSGLKEESRAVTFNGKNIAELSNMSILDCYNFFNNIELTPQEEHIAGELLKEIKIRLHFLVNVGLPYLNLNRRANTLSGGENQRIRLGTQIGSGLEDVLYILDEPSIGLHNRDNMRLIQTLQTLKEKGNTVLVSEHDIDTMLAADWIIDIGPGAGVEGGKVVAEGKPDVIPQSKESITGKYLSGNEYIPIPKKRREKGNKVLVIEGAAEHNLKNINVNFPLELFICVTGVSGSGKSSLVSDIIWPALARKLNRAETKPGKYESISGLKHLDKVIEIDQKPIGYTPRSVPATYSKVLDHIRDFYASLPISQARGYKKGRFSFNTKAGRCPECKGLGYKRIEMQFLPSMDVECEVCEGRRFGEATLEIKYHGKNIADVLDMTITEANVFFKDHPKILNILQTLEDVGLGYLKLGQPSPTLSGGEAQRVKIARELSKRSTGSTLYLLEEPTVGLHSFDVKKLLEVLNRLVDEGNTVVVVEHNLDVIKSADWIIDLGPEGGDLGGEVVAVGTPREISKVKKSFTGQALQKVFKEKLTIKNPLQNNHKIIEKPSSQIVNYTKNKKIEITGAKKNNLKNINVTIPKNKLTVITGISGSGKSSLAIDTLFAEGQRRFVESLSTYARQFLGIMDSGLVQKIEGLSPAIAIDQKRAPKNPRSTVGTITEINDYLRILFATVGISYCPQCGENISPLSIDEMVKRISSFAEGQRTKIIAPLVKESHGNFKPLLKELLEEGFTRIIIDDKEILLDELVYNNKKKKQTNLLDKKKKHTIELVIDRLVISKEYKEQLFESLEVALDKGEGVVKIQTEKEKTAFFSTRRQCFKCGVKLPDAFTPKMFSFNSHVGACPRCKGIGTIKKIDPELLIKDKTESIAGGAVGLIPKNKSRHSYIISLISAVAKEKGFSLNTPIKNYTKKQLNALLYGIEEQVTLVREYNREKYSSKFTRDQGFKGLIPLFESWMNNTKSMSFQSRIESYCQVDICPNCNGSRINPNYLSIRIGGFNFKEITKMSISNAYHFFKNLGFGGADRIISQRILEELQNRLQFLIDVGLDYLTLDRNAKTLSGGEMQRIRLANQIGNKLKGVLYVLDEPSIGLHPRDNSRLLQTLRDLRDLGNTVVVIEHDGETIRGADHLVDLGPGAGENGGEVVASGKITDIIETKESLTGKYLRGDLVIPRPKKRREVKDYLILKNVRHNNLKNITAKFPLNVFSCVTGVSGSGKSSLVNETLYRTIAKKLYRAKAIPGEYDKLIGLEKIDKVVLIDQDAIGRSSRSNSVTYTGAFDYIRELFASMPEAQIRGFTSSRFSFNNKEGRCPICEGRGIKTIEMLFLSDVEISCEECHGKRYNQETLKVKYKGKTIADVLGMTVENAIELFKNQPQIHKRLKVLKEVGLGYVKLGQTTSTLSGGEAQRLKLASELSRPQTGKTLYLFDEPTVGLAAYDVKHLIKIIQKLVNIGNTVIMIEHNLDVIKCADWIIDLGPEGGNRGGKIVVEGTLEKIIKCSKSITGNYLKAIVN